MTLSVRIDLIVEKSRPRIHVSFKEFAVYNNEESSSSLGDEKGTGGHERYFATSLNEGMHCEAVMMLATRNIRGLFERGFENRLFDGTRVKVARYGAPTHHIH